MTERRDLIDIFTPPADHVGYCAAMVAMTGDEDFLEAALRRFSNLSAGQRAAWGLLQVYLMLDAHETTERRTVFPPGQIPGLYELQPRALDRETLIHSKVAILGFSTSHTAAPTKFRLAVLSSNFTNASAAHHLELVWTLDVAAADAPAIDRADLAGAASFITALAETRFHWPDRPQGATGQLMSRLQTLLSGIVALRPERSATRFIHSLTEPLYSQIRRSFSRHTQNRRNLLICGSAFYEQPTKKARQPEVLKKLEAIGGLTSTPRFVALVQPEQAGAIAEWAEHAEECGWELARPHDFFARNSHRRLHAKFVYLGYLRDGRASNGSLYIGSGNLTQRGLFSSAATQGNIECGVVFQIPESRHLEDLGESLFWDDGNAEISADEFRVGDVGDLPERPELLATPPILAGYVLPADPPALSIVWSTETADKISLSWLGREWIDVSHKPQTIALAAGIAPPALRVRDDETGTEWNVPVVDPAGRVSWSPPAHPSYEDLVAALLTFPLEADAEPDAEEDNAGSPQERKKRSAARRPKSRTSRDRPRSLGIGENQLTLTGT